MAEDNSEQNREMHPPKGTSEVVKENWPTREIAIEGKTEFNRASYQGEKLPERTNTTEQEGVTKSTSNIFPGQEDLTVVTPGEENTIVPVRFAELPRAIREDIQERRRGDVETEPEQTLSPTHEAEDGRPEFYQKYSAYMSLRSIDPTTLPTEQQAAYPAILEQRKNEVKELFSQAREEGILDDVDNALSEIYDMVRYRFKKDPDFVITALDIARREKKKTQISRQEFVETALSLENSYWHTFEDEGGAWKPDQTRFRGIRAQYFSEGIRRISQEFAQARNYQIPSEQLRLEEWEWNIEDRADIEPKLWDRSELNTLLFKSDLLRDRADLERAFRQFIRYNLSTGNITVDFVLGEKQPLENQVRSEAHRLGLGGDLANRLAAEAGGRLFLFAADWFSRIGKRKEVQQIMERFTDDSTEKVIGLVLSYEGKPMEAASLLTFTGDEGLIGLTPEMPLYKEFKELGIYRPDKLRFIHYYRPDGPSGELYNDKVKGEKFQDLIKRALVNKLATSGIKSRDESGNESKEVKDKNLEKATLGLEGQKYRDISDREFLDLFSQAPDNIEKLNGVINEAMQAYYDISVMERDELTGNFSMDQMAQRDKIKEEKKKIIKHYESKTEADEAKEAVTIGTSLLTVFGFSSELLCPRIWKRESISYVSDPEGKYVFDEEDGVYIPATRFFKTDKNGQIQYDQQTGLPKAEFEYDPKQSRFRRVQGEYARDEDGRRILVSIEEEIRERLGYDANNNNSFFPLDDRSRTVFLTPEYPKPGWMEEYRKHLDPKGFMRYVSNLPEQRDLLIRKVGEDWKRYIRAHRQLMIDYAQDGMENEKADFSGIVPEDFVERYREDYPEVDLSSPEIQESLKSEYLEFVKSGFNKEQRGRVYTIPGMFAYQPDIIYGGGAPFAIKKNEYLSWWVIGDPIQNAQKTSDRSIAFISLLDTGVRSVARKYTGGPYFRRFIQGLALKDKGDPIVLDDYETQIWVGEFGGADDLRLSAVGRDIEGRSYQSGFLHSFLDKKEELKNPIVALFYGAGIQNTPIEWKKFSKEQQYKLLESLLAVFNRQFAFTASYLVHNERSSVHEEGKWFGVRFMNGVFDLAGSEYGYYAYPDLAYTLYVILNKVKLSEFQNKTPREVLMDLYVKNYR